MLIPNIPYFESNIDAMNGAYRTEKSERLLDLAAYISRGVNGPAVLADQDGSRCSGGSAVYDGSICVRRHPIFL